MNPLSYCQLHDVLYASHARRRASSAASSGVQRDRSTSRRVSTPAVGNRRKIAYSRPSGAFA